MAGFVLWLQNAAYPARWDRQLIAEVFGWRERITRGLLVTQNGAGDNTVNVSPGVFIVVGDDQPNQGMGLGVFEEVENVAMPAAPATDQRVDLIVATMNDPQAGGPAGSNATISVVQGVASGSPTPPTVPTSAVEVARVLRSAGDGAVLDAAITQTGPRGTFPYTVSTAPVPATLPPNDLYIRVS